MPAFLRGFGRAFVHFGQRLVRERRTGSLGTWLRQPRTSRGRQSPVRLLPSPRVLTAPSVRAAGWRSIFLRWQLRRALALAIAARILLSAMLLYAHDDLATLMADVSDEGRTPVDLLTGAGVALYAVALTMALAAVDAARFGAPDLMANLGYSRAIIVALSAVPPALLEIVINVAVHLA